MAQKKGELHIENIMCPTQGSKIFFEKWLLWVSCIVLLCLSVVLLLLLFLLPFSASLQVIVHVTYVFFLFSVHTVVIIHWTRQIKELLTSQESLDTSTSSGPLEEIEFWRARCDDYSSLTQQLDQSGVKKVVGILQKAKSSYITPFHNLSLYCL